ncbi:hypothetical protein [Streptomyces sp. NBC_01236]|uniref:hypothetical protein n=1 Tax=Streptomyces sp. NBC_01236 TaxID=2903789 RepID=UPI002E164FAF|nr:hypothetical protein OG324_18115 [Streptomyces sp. NBC_01236]
MTRVEDDKDGQDNQDDEGDPPPGRAGSAPPNRPHPSATWPAALGGVLLLIAAWLLLVNVRGALAEEREFRAAVACPTRTVSTGGSEDCLRTVTARIDRAERDTKHKGASYWLYVTEPGGKKDSAWIKGHTPGSPTAWSGAHVKVTLWRGEIRYVDFPAGRLSTHADPRGSYRPRLAASLGIGFFGLAPLWAGYWWARRSMASPLRAPWQLSLPMVGALTLAATSAVVALVTHGIWTALECVAVAAGVVLLGCTVAALALRRRQKDDDTIEVTPSVPTSEQCFAGSVLGEGRYSAGGGGYLVAAPGVLLTTPDPTGAFARRPVPSTLTFVRVRPPYWTDPHSGDYAAENVVIECHDGETPVVIVTKKENVAWVPGALESVATAP